MALPALADLATPEFPPVEVYYPESDGRPMAETDIHARYIIDLRTALESYFADEPNVYVSGHLLMYYQQGDPRQSVAPDIFVVRGVPKGLRRVYKLWEEGRAPDFVLEVSSRSTRAEDLGAKYGLYQWMGVHEYFLFDPLREYLNPPLQGYRLVGGRYEPLRSDAQGGFTCEALGLELRFRGEVLRIYDPRANEWLPVPSEEAAARREAEAHAAKADALAAALEARAAAAEKQAAAEAEARRAAEAELERLRAELARITGKQTT